MHSYDINWRKIGVMFLIFCFAFTGMGVNLGTPVSYAAEEGVYVSRSGDDISGDGTRNNPFATLQKAYLVVNNEGTIYLLDDITLTGGGDVVVAINVAKHVTISTAPDIEKTAVIKRGDTSGKVLFQLENNSQVTLRNIIIDGNAERGSLDGRLFNVYSGSTLTLDEGAILQNSYSWHLGSAIYVTSTTVTDSTVEMKGGEISGNKRRDTSGAGKAVYVGSRAKFIMTGGLVTNNTDGGVQSKSDGQILLSGDAVIAGNTYRDSERNVYLEGNNFLYLNGNFTGEAGITAYDRMTVGRQFGQASGGSWTGLENLTADNYPNLFAIYGESNALVWQLPPTVEITTPAGSTVYVAQPVFEGTTDAGADVTVEIKDKAGNIVGTPTVTVNPDGTWSFTPDSDLADGEYTVEVTATWHGKSTKETKDITVDATPPSLEFTAPTGDKVYVAQPVFEGTTDAGADVTVEIKDKDGNIVGTPTVTVNPDGTWSFTSEDALADGAYTVEVTATKDGKINKETKNIIVDTTPPSLEITAPTGDTIYVARPTFEGTTDVGVDVTVEIKDKAGNIVGTPTVTVSPDGTWSFTPDSDLADGEYTVVVTATKGGISTATETKTITVDTSKPTATIDQPSGQVFVARPEISGTATPDSQVTITYTDKSGNLVAETIDVGSDGLWSHKPATDLAEGDTEITVIVEKNGKTSTPVTKTVSIDTEKVDKTALQALVTDTAQQIDAGTLRAEDYTSESWRELQDKLTVARNVLNDDQATRTQVDQAFKDLAQALNNLESIQAPATGAPVVDSVQVNDAEPNKLVLTFDRDITLTDANGFSIIGSYGTISVTDYVYHGATLTLTLNSTVEPGQLLTISYEQENGSIVAADGGQALASFTRRIVDNRVQAPQPPTGKLNALGLTYTDGTEITTNPGFTPDNLGIYAVTVSNGTRQISIDPEAEAGTSLKVFHNGVEVAVSDWSALPLQVGRNTIELKVYDLTGKILKNTYTIEITRQSASRGGGGGGNSGGGGTPPAGEESGEQPGIISTDNGNKEPFATGEKSDQGTTVNIDSGKLQDILGDGQAHQLGIEVNEAGDVNIQGLTAEDLRQLRETGSTLEISTSLARYPVPQDQLNLEALAQHFGNTVLEEIEVQITIRPANAALVQEVQRTAARGNYELLTDPVQVNLTFSHDGRTTEIDHLNGYAAKYIALPAGLDPNRITTGIITYPDGTVFHVPTVVVTRDGQYFAKINDLLSHGTYSVIWNPKSFSDVENHWVQAAANNMGARLVIEGTGNNRFEPNREVTRAEFATFIARGLGLMHQDVEQNIFKDVQTGKWYHDPIVIASQFGIVLGYDEGTFRGEQQITREQGIAMIARAYRLIKPQQTQSQAEVDSILAKHADSKNISSWAQADVAMMVSLGIVYGDSQLHLNPQAEMTRAEAAALIQRILQQTGLID
ncbi:hypothetical protein DUZ99_10020 [Xylanibacillus composti]|uniref:SLH domain-containing protein n=1 Tax=Xylanibacillus composti TaxID=1572762 RepID=A0A8J4H566_9BACL|nr:Ig-like domain-containing protein [Xylanibacillus composti]MDT9725307.1 hypothetical protein [Xylanibacillus composti]GIQ71177.1 hypothetical protein XYCOK13_40010 [Xylanibacillus composti]